MRGVLGVDFVQQTSVVQEKLCTYMHTHTQHIHTCMHIHAHVNMHACIHTYIHAYINIYITLKYI